MAHTRSGRRLALVACILLAGCLDREDSPVAPPRADLVQDGSAPLYTVSNAAPDRYIVVYREDSGLGMFPSQLVAPTEFRTMVEQTVSDLGGTLHATWQAVFPGFAATLSPEAVARLQRDPRVRLIEQDPIVSIDGAAAPGSQSGAIWGLDRIDQRSPLLDGTYNYPASGTGVRVYVLDTGIRTSHTQFGGRAFIGADFIGDGQNGNDCNGHGTHVAGTVGGSTYGVAKSSWLIAVRVLGCNGISVGSSIISGMDWVRLNGVRPAVLNMSLGGGGSVTSDIAVTNLYNAGFLTIAAAGNSNVDACGTSPARAPEAVTVGATSYFSAALWDLKADYSNFGSCLDIWAPGTGILSAWHTGNTATNTLQGTSMAAPHVAGAAALYLELFPNATPAGVTSALVTFSTKDLIIGPGAGSPNRLLFAGFRGAVAGFPEQSKVSVGGYHACVLQDSGLIECRGLNNAGQAPATRSSPFGVYAQLSAGGFFTCGVSNLGGVDCFGANESGQSVTQFNPPGTTFRKVSAGGSHGCALTNARNVYCWGLNGSGQAPPTALSGVYVDVASGGNHTCALRADGSADCWGANGAGQAPSNRTAASGSVWFTALAAGWEHTCAITSSGNAECWGRNNYFQAPATISPGGGRRFLQIAAGDFHTCALRSEDNRVVCWGAGAVVAEAPYFGQAPSERQSSTGHPYTHVGAGWQTSCARTNQGLTECFGRNNFGQARSDQRILFTLSLPTPAIATGFHVPVASASSGLAVSFTTANPAICTVALGVIRFIAAGTCEVRANQAGNASWMPAPQVTQTFTIAPPVAAPAPPVTSTGGAHSCVLRDGKVACWGWNGYNQALPTRSAAVGSFTQLAAGSNFNCARRSDGVVECWGNNDKGQAPATRTAVSGQFVQVAVGFDFACALRTDGAIHCWGNNEAGQAPHLREASTALHLGRYVQVSAGGDTACALRADGVVECWGGSPATRSATSGHFTEVSVGWAHGCALRNNGTLQCWGDNSTGAAPATRSALTYTFTQVSAGGSVTCARRADGVAECFGTNNNGQAPATKTTPTGFSSVSAGTLHSCGMSGYGLSVCWGESGNGEGRSEQVASFSSGSPGTTMVGATWNLTGITTSGLPPAFGSATPAVCTVNGSTAVMEAAGSCTLTIDQAGNATWLPAIQGRQTFDVVPIPTPPAPSGFSATPISAIQVDLSWADVGSLETGYTLQRRQSTGPGTWGTWGTIAQLAANSTSYSDPLVVPQTLYEYRVRACSPGGCSAWAITSVTTPAGVLPPPTAPGALTALPSSATAVRLAWTDESNNEVRFSIHRRERIDGVYTDWAEIATPAANSTGYNNTGLVTGRQYQYRIRSCHSSGCSVFVVAPAVTPVGAPAAPSNLAPSIVNASRIGLTWTDNSDNETRFGLGRRERAAGGDWSAWQEIARPGPDLVAYINTGLTSDVTYQYRIRACNTGGCSDFTTATPLLLPGVPAMPGAVTSSVTTSTRITTTWSDQSSNESAFTVQRRVRTEGTWSAWLDVASLPSGSVSYLSTGLTTGLTYQHRVRACNASGCSDYGTSLATPIPFPPAAPLDLVSTPVSPTQVNLVWTDASNNELGFELARRVRVDGVWGEWMGFATTPSPSTAYNVVGLSPGGTFQFRVRACNAAGCSSYLNGVPVSTPAGEQP